jgi:translation elongation factor P/translation initiation factor 5A
LRYDVATRKWQVIDENNLNVYGTFSTGKTGDLTNQQLDASWIIRFLTNGSTYTVTTRGLRYVFESKREVRFYYDSADRNFNVQTGKTLQDKIAVLAVNTKPDSTANFNLDLNFSVSTEFRNAEGYVDSSKIELSQFDSDQDGIVDDPDAFNHVVDPETNPLTKYVFQKLVTGSTGTTRYDYVDAATEKIYVRQTSVGTIGDYTNGDIVYLVDSDSFKQINTSTNTTSDLTNYIAHVGRDKIKFQYVHISDCG